MDDRSPPTPTEFVAVIVVTFNSEALLADLVASLEPGLAGVAWSLTIVDNDSSDGTVDAARTLAPHATVIATGRNGGYAAGINVGMAASPGCTAVLVLNPDVRLGRGCVAELLQYVHRPGTGIVVPRLVDARGQLIESQRREPTVVRALSDAVLGARRAGRHPALGEVVTDDELYLRSGVTDWAEGSTLLISAECSDAVGAWDESYFLYSEETDFALRARDAGFATVYVPSAEAVHLEGGSAGSSELWPFLVANRLRLYGNRNGGVKTALFWCVLVLREATRSLIGKRPSRAALAALLSPARLRAPRGPDWIRN